MKKETLNCEKARSICIVQTLAKLGHFPNRTSEKEAWFLSPFRSETQASFKVSLKQNYWIDFGTFEGGNVIDLVCLIKQCSVREALYILNNENIPFSFQQPTSSDKQQGIEILNVLPIRHPALLGYLKFRRIKPRTARRYCREVHYACKGKKYFAIGLENVSGGYELRNRFYKNCSSPKDISLVKHARTSLVVCEGLFDMLSLLSYAPSVAEKNDVLVLNSVAYVKKIKTYLAPYNCISLYLDRDSAGRKATGHLLEQSPKCVDMSPLYNGFTDLNDWWVSQKQLSG